MRLIKDPDAKLDYAWDWTAWLTTDETITMATVLPVTGLTIESVTHAAGIVTAWISGGTLGQDYSVTCRITTSAGRIDDRTISIRVVQR